MVFKKISDNLNKDYGNPDEKKKETSKNISNDTKKVNNDEKVKGNDKEQFDFLVELNDIWGTSSKRLDPIGVRRAIMGGNVWLINEKLNFKEPMPEDTDEYKAYKKEELSAEISRIEKKLRDIKTKNTKETSRDLQQDLKQLQGWFRSLELQGRGSYMNLSSKRDEGMPYFMFDRKGNFKLPVFKNIDYSLMYVPNEAKISDASDLLKENEEKNGLDKNQIKLINYILTFGLMITLGFMFYFMYKTNATQSLYVGGGLNNLTTVIGDIVTQNQNTIDIMKEVINKTAETTADTQITINPETIN